jgi:hypothetical protein
MVQKFSLDVEMNKILSSNAYKQHSKPLSKKASAEELKSAEILGCLKDLHDICEALGEDVGTKEKCVKCIKDLVACCKSDEILAWAEKHGYAEEAKEEDVAEGEEKEESEDSSKADDSFAFEVSL